MKRVASFALIILMLLEVLCACQPAHVHEYGEWVVTKEATCGDNVGIFERVCGCGARESKEALASIAHDYEPSMVVAPTTEADGYTLYVCKGCGDGYESDAIEKLPTLRDGMMVYYEDFEELNETMSSDEIFRALGWKRLIKSGQTSLE